MNSNRPDVTDEDVGMRTFRLRKATAVERAIERLRAGLKDNWSLFSQRDLADLKWVFGELWAFETRAEWDALHFSKLGADDVVAIVGIARTLRADPHGTVETLERVRDIIRAKSV
jgi:hypothetical protein